MKTPHRLRRALLYACAVLWAALLPLGVTAQPAPLARAHAHNDYQHDRPLLDALDHGFCSVEADIHLVDGVLLVAHDADEVHPERTLEALYLEPLRQRARANGGRIYADRTPFYLLIDIKSEAEPTYAALRELLQRYADIMTIFTPDGKAEGALTVIVSGNRPRAMMAEEVIRYAAYDGRLEDLSMQAEATSTFIPLISMSWASVSSWRGHGEMPSSLRREILRIVETAHAQGRMVRFWATPDDPKVWKALYDLGVDLLNTDDLNGLRAFLIAHGTD